jgi:uncharacterized RDD family membrane protein YckC
MTEEKFFAGFWVRLFAGLLDLAFLLPLLIILVFCFGTSEYQMVKIDDDFHSYSYLGTSVSNRLIDIISYGLSIAYLGYFLASKKQATFGKRILGIYVGNPDGSRLSLQKSIARALASMLTAATLGLGLLLIIFTKEKTALHDIICNSRVFHGKKND